MSNDLIERLRRYPEDEVREAADEIERIGALWKAAENNAQLRVAMLNCQADEIERLRAQNHQLNKDNIAGLGAYERVEAHNIKLDNEIEQLRAEIERLRAENEELKIELRERE